MLSFLLDLIENIALVLASLALATVGIAAMIGMGPPFPFKARVGGLVLSLGTFLAGVVYGLNSDRQSLRELQNAVKEAQEREALLDEQAFERLLTIRQLEGVVEGYETELENGSAVSCAADPAYSRRLRSIIESAQPASQ